MKRTLYFLTISIISLFLVLSCGNAKLTELKKTVKDVADNLNTELIAVRDISTQLNKELVDLFSNTDIENVDIKGMDESEGGSYYLFKDKMYLKRYDPKNDEIITYFTGATPLSDNNKKVLKMLDSLNDSIVRKVKSNPNLGRYSFATVNNEALTYPPADIASLLPPGLDYNVLPNFNEAKQKASISYWRNPIISSGAVGVTMSTVNVVKDNNEVIGVGFLETKLLKMLSALIKDLKPMILIPFQDSTVYAATDSLLKSISIKVTEQVDYTEQLKLNKNISDEFKLSYEKNSDGIKALGTLITKENTGKNGLSVTINNKKYSVIIEAVPEKEFFIVGLL